MRRKILAVTLLFAILATILPLSVVADDERLVWRVPPTLEYGFIRYCSWCIGSDDIRGMFYIGFGYVAYSTEIDRKTGQLIDDEWGHGAHGLGRSMWIYDNERNLFGRESGDESGRTVRLYPFYEMKEHFPFLEGMLIRIYSVDSSMRIIADCGCDLIPRESYFGAAVMYDGEFVTDFIFDIVEWSEGLIRGDTFTSDDWRNDVISMRFGDKWGFIDRNGDIVIPFVFEHIVVIDNYTAFAHYNGKYGILDTRLTMANITPTNPIAPATSDNIYHFVIAAFMMFIVTLSINRKLKLRRL